MNNFDLPFDLYTRSPKAYHNWDHAMLTANVARNIAKVNGLTDQQIEILTIAAIWHDCIYETTRYDNEERSADALLLLHPTRLEAARLIRKTRVADHLSMDCTFENDPLLAVLLDADLISLTEESYERFVETQKRILSEHGKTDLSLSATFLKQFLDKPAIYRSPVGRDECESRARENISKFTKEFSK